MYYDQGPLPGGGVQRPVGAMPAARYAPSVTQRTPAPAFVPGNYDSPETRAFYKSLKRQTPGMRRQPMPQPMYGGTMQPPQSSGPAMLRRYGAAGGSRLSTMPGGPPQYDHLGNLPGDWDYQEPVYQQPAPQLGFHSFAPMYAR